MARQESERLMRIAGSIEQGIEFKGREDTAGAGLHLQHPAAPELAD